MSAKTFSLSEAQSELAALKAELQEKRTAVSLLQDEMAYHQGSLRTLQAQRDRLALNVGMATESVKGATASVRRNQGRPNEAFAQQSLDDALSDERDATTLLEAHDAAGAIKLAEGLVKASQDKLKAAESDLSRMSHKADDLSKKFQLAFQQHGQAIYDKAIERLSRPGAYLLAQEQTLQQLQEHADAESATVRTLRTEQATLVQQSLSELSDFSDLAAKLAEQYTTDENAAIRAILNATLVLLNAINEDGPAFRQIQGQRWWDLMAILKIDYLWAASNSDMVEPQIRDITAYLDTLPK